VEAERSEHPAGEQGLGNLWHVWILDVEGTRVVVLAANAYAGTPAEDRAEMQAILDSLLIEPGDCDIPPSSGVVHRPPLPRVSASVSTVSSRD